MGLSMIAGYCNLCSHLMEKMIIPTIGFSHSLTLSILACSVKGLFRGAETHPVLPWSFARSQVTILVWGPPKSDGTRWVGWPVRSTLTSFGSWSCWTLVNLVNGKVIFWPFWREPLGTCRQTQYQHILESLSEHGVYSEYGHWIGMYYSTYIIYIYI